MHPCPSLLPGLFAPSLCSVSRSFGSLRDEETGQLTEVPQASRASPRCNIKANRGNVDFLWLWL